MLWKQSLICKTDFQARSWRRADSGYIHRLCEALSKEFLSLAMTIKAEKRRLPSPKTQGNLSCCTCSGESLLIIILAADELRKKNCMISVGALLV